MSFQVTIKTVGIDNWADPSEVKRKSENFFRKVGIDGAQELTTEANKINATGQLVRSIKSKATPTEVKVQATVDYATEALETGSPPGTTPNMKALQAWSKIRFGNEGLAVPIARSIKARGTKKWRKKGPKQVTEVFNKIKDTIIPKYISEVEEFFI